MRVLHVSPTLSFHYYSKTRGRRPLRWLVPVQLMIIKIALSPKSGELSLTGWRGDTLYYKPKPEDE